MLRTKMHLRLQAGKSRDIPIYAVFIYLPWLWNRCIDTVSVPLEVRLKDQ